MEPRDALVEMERACQALSGGLSWEWDGRFSAALTVVKDPNHHTLLPTVAAQLPHAWDAKSIRGAPRRIVALAGKFGGIHPGQQMLTTDPEADPLLLALWWPWGGGDTFSLRVTCLAETAEAAALEPLAALRACFGV